MRINICPIKYLRSEAIHQNQAYSSANQTTLATIQGLNAPILLPGCFQNTHECQDYLNQYIDLVAQFPTEGLPCRPDFELIVENIETPGRDRPTIGITVSEISWLNIAQVKDLVSFVERNNCQPVLIPPSLDLLMPQEQTARIESINQYCKNFDGLIGRGGLDVSPSIYGEKNTNSEQTNFRRDHWESTLLMSALFSGQTYIFAICRSHQLIHATLGGTLNQDLKADGLIKHWPGSQRDLGFNENQLYQVFSREKELFSYTLDSKPGSIISQHLGPRSISNSLHHQAVKHINYGQVTATHTDPQTKATLIEATESKNMLTVQFHPEYLLGHSQFANLLATTFQKAHSFWLKKRHSEH